ncbi:MAG: sulfurtransferase-like selenium metabolism protein YedF [Saccharofermentanales bacterium]|jgi:selenium metabolism protein YedF
MIKVNAIGDACPLPVVKTKKELEKIASGVVEVTVDNETAVENLTRFANARNCEVASRRDGDHYIVTITKPEDAGEPAEAPAAAVAGPTIVVLSSNRMGKGNDELGAILMKSFLFALKQLEHLPETIIMYNSGVLMSLEGAETVDDLKELADAGVTIRVCGTCLDFFERRDDVAVGTISNMYEIVETMDHAGHIIRP